MKQFVSKVNVSFSGRGGLSESPNGSPNGSPSECLREACRGGLFASLFVCLQVGSVVSPLASLRAGLQSGLCVLLVSLVACSNGYQAPVSEQGEREVVTPPLIVDSNSPDAVLRAATPRRQTVARSSPTTSRQTASAVSRQSTSAASVPVIPNAQLGQSHRVSRGETLYSIAYQHDLDFRALALANGLNPPYTIFVDQVLNLDASNPVASGSSRASASSNSTLGTAVSNNSVARAQGTAATGGVMRQPIGGSSNAEPTWQWPRPGRVVRGFENGQNKGIDIDGRIGDPVYAAGSGDVVYSGRGIQGTGELIIIRHSDRYLSAYAYNRAMLVHEGERVQAGQQIAEVGAGPTGDAMLHFEIRLDGKSIDPTGILPRQ